MLIHVNSLKVDACLTHELFALIEKAASLLTILIPFVCLQVIVLVFIKGDFSLTLTSQTHSLISTLISLAPCEKSLVMRVLKALLSCHVELCFE